MAIKSKKITSSSVLKSVLNFKNALPVISSDINVIVDDLESIDSRVIVLESSQGGGDGGTGLILIGKLINANMNTTADQPIVIAAGNYVVQAIMFTNPSVAISNLDVELWTGVNKTGINIDSSSLTLNLTKYKIIELALSGDTASSLFFSMLDTFPATCDVRVYGYKLS